MAETIRELVSEEEVEKRVCELGRQISEDYAGRQVHLICVLKGGVFFMCELALSYLIQILEKRGPKSLKLCTLLDKPERRVKPVTVDYVGFNIPDEFVVGYGLDYAQKYRNLPYIGVVEGVE